MVSGESIYLHKIRRRYDTSNKHAEQIERAQPGLNDSGIFEFALLTGESIGCLSESNLNDPAHPLEVGPVREVARPPPEQRCLMHTFASLMSHQTYR